MNWNNLTHVLVVVIVDVVLLGAAASSSSLSFGTLIRKMIFYRLFKLSVSERRSARWRRRHHH